MLSTPHALSSARLALLLAAVALLWWSWEQPWVYPLRLLVTLLHEVSHGLGALATGGSIERITVAADGSGLCYTRGGWRSVIIPAGYLGSMLWGCAILLLACRTHWDRALAFALGAFLVLMSVLYIRSPVGLGAGIAWGLAFIGAARWLGRDANDLALTFIGVASCLYALFDLRTLLRLGTGFNDATLFSAEILPLPPRAWAALWSVLAIVVLALALRLAVRSPAAADRGLPGANG